MNQRIRYLKKIHQEYFNDIDFSLAKLLVDITYSTDPFPIDYSDLLIHNLIQDMTLGYIKIMFDNEYYAKKNTDYVIIDNDIRISQFFFEALLAYNNEKYSRYHEFVRYFIINYTEYLENLVNYSSS